MTLPSYVGRYEVRKEIGRGGFAVVVQAWDEELQSLVALKILHRELAHDEEVQLRFLEEARLLRQIRSSNVVTVHDVGRLNDGRPYFVMDFADRGTLAPRLDRMSGYGALDPQSIIALVDAVADGLTAIHDAGVVHRDIKPDNILFQVARRGQPEPDAIAAELGTRTVLVKDDERILVSDLGIAKDLMKHGSAVTILGGTPLYRAPEQEEDDAEVTPAADVYAATALLLHILSGQKPPGAKNVESRLATLPTTWREVIEEGMAIDPKARFASIESWRSAVLNTLAHEVAEPRGARPTEAIESAAPCPYKGLGAYQPEDAHRFFGREALIDELVRRIWLQKVLVVGGPSGSGKSSLVRAGLIPALNAGALHGSEKWRSTLLTPGHDPLAELHFQVSRTLPSGKSPVSLEDLLAHPTMARHLGWSNGQRAATDHLHRPIRGVVHADVGGATQQVHCRPFGDDGPGRQQGTDRHRHSRGFLCVLRANTVVGGANNGEPGASRANGQFRAPPGHHRARTTRRPVSGAKPGGRRHRRSRSRRGLVAAASHTPSSRLGYADRETP